MLNEEERRELNFWYSKKTDNIDKVYGVEKIFRRTKVDEKSTTSDPKNITEKGQHYLNKINLPDDKKQPFIELANYLLKRDS